MRNSLNTIATEELLLQSDVCVWHEYKGWKGLYKLLATNRETCTIDIPYSLTNFRSTVIRRYYAEEEQVRPVEEPVNKPVNIQRQEQPLESRNKAKPEATRRSPWQHAANL
jgi:hypothetical protein